MSTLSTTNIKHPSSASNNVVLDSSGQVGVGTASPGYKLHVSGGQVRIEETASTSDGVLWLKGSSASNGGAISGVNSSGGAGPLKFYTGSTEAARITSSSDLQFNSGYGSVATAYGCRAWVNFQGTGTVDIRASGNVSSITDNGSGDYTVNFATALSDASYCAFGSVIGSSNTDATDAFVSAGFNAATATHTTSAFRFTTAHRTQGAQDYNQVQVAVIR